MQNKSTNRKYITISEYVDIETGEIITKSLYEREYIKINNTKTYEHRENTTVTKWTIECKKNPQLSIW